MILTVRCRTLLLSTLLLISEGECRYGTNRVGGKRRINYIYSPRTSSKLSNRERIFITPNPDYQAHLFSSFSSFLIPPLSVTKSRCPCLQKPAPFQIHTWGPETRIPNLTDCQQFWQVLVCFVALTEDHRRGGGVDGFNVVPQRLQKSENYVQSFRIHDTDIKSEDLVFLALAPCSILAVS